MSDSESETAYWAECERVHGEVRSAMKIFYTYLEIHRTAARQAEVFALIQRHPLFWNIQLYALQAAFFVVLFRIFDTGVDAHSITRLCTRTRTHPEYFSRSALTARKRAAATADPTAWLAEYVAAAWEPRADDLDDLGLWLRPHRQAFQNIYSPIRTRVFAHDLLADQGEAADLIGRANIAEVQRTLLALFEVTENLWQLYQNGRRFERHVPQFIKERRRIRLAARAALKQGSSPD